MDITSHVCKEETKRAEKDRKLERKVEERQDMRWDEMRREGFEEGELLEVCVHMESFFVKELCSGIL